MFNEELVKALCSGKAEVDITMYNPDEDNFSIERTKEHLLLAEHELTTIFNRKGYLTRYDLWSALGVDLRRMTPFEDEILIGRW